MSPSNTIKGAVSQFAPLCYVEPIFFKLVVCNPFQSSPSLTILFLLWFITSSLMIFYLSSKLQLSGFLQFKGYFVRGQSNSKVCD